MNSWRAVAALLLCPSLQCLALPMCLINICELKGVNVARLTERHFFLCLTLLRAHWQNLKEMPGSMQWGGGGGRAWRHWANICQMKPRVDGVPDKLTCTDLERAGCRTETGPGGKELLSSPKGPDLGEELRGEAGRGTAALCLLEGWISVCALDRLQNKYLCLENRKFTESYKVLAMGSG